MPPSKGCPCLPGPASDNRHLSTSTPTDWDAPLNADGPSRSAALRSALGLTATELPSFIGELHAGISSAVWGFPQLAGIPDVEQRALVSDQLLSAADGMLDALVDGAISVLDVDVHTGPTGLPYPDAEDSLNNMLRYEWLRRAVSDLFDAVGTTLDCMAAVLVVVTRAPLSVQRADFAQLSNLDPEKAHAAAFAEPVPEVQHDLWADLLAELRAAATDGPPDWLGWSLEMRNALTHRGRVTNVYLPRSISRRLAVPPTSQPQRLYRYDLHLRRRPWLPALEGMLAGPGLPDSWLDEPAGRTAEGVRDALLKFVERMMRWAAELWGADLQQRLVAPIRRWGLPAPPSIAFAGARPGGTTPISGAIGGINEEHVRLAERVRRLRESVPEDEDPAS